MATLTLTKVFINLVSTGEYVAAQSAPGRSQGTEVRGEVRPYAGGRQRAVQILGESTTFGLTLRNVTAAQRATLQDWKGQTVLVRDHRGQAFVGVYFSTESAEAPSTDLYDVTLAIRTTTASLEA